MILDIWWRWRQLNSEPKLIILNINLDNGKILYPIFTQIRFSALNPKTNLFKSSQRIRT